MPAKQLSIPNCIFDKEYDLSPYSLPARHYHRKSSFVPKEFHDCSYVWLSRGASTSSLQRPYVGPYKVIDRNFSNHTVKILLNGKTETVAMERLKPAFFVVDTVELNHALTHPSHTVHKMTVTFA